MSEESSRIPSSSESVIESMSKGRETRKGEKTLLTWVRLNVSHQTCPFPSIVPPPKRWMLVPERNQKVVLFEGEFELRDWDWRRRDDKEKNGRGELTRFGRSKTNSAETISQYLAYTGLYTTTNRQT